MLFFNLLSLFRLFLNRAFTFDSVQSAQRAKASLNGADIYSGCCTLKIEYAKVVFLYTDIKTSQFNGQTGNVAFKFSSTWYFKKNVVLFNNPTLFTHVVM